MAGEELIGKGKVEVTADVKPFDAAMAELPKKAASKMDAAMKALQARAAQTKLDLKIAYNTGNLAEQQRLIPIYDNLRTKIAAVEGAAIRQAQAIRATAAAAQQAATAAQAQAAAQQRAAAAGPGFNSIWLDQQVIGKMSQAGAAGKKMGADVREGSGNGAMGLMLLAQTIDDAQYGFRAIVNNIPQVALAVGTAMGMSSESAMKFGGALGIASVAINTWVNNWEHAKAAFGGSGGGVFDDIIKDMNRVGDSARSLFATLLNLGNGWDWVSTTGAETAAVAKQVEDKAAFAERRARQVEANRASVSGMKGTADETRGRAFSAAVGAYGGGDELAKNLVGQRMIKFNHLSGEAYRVREERARQSVDNDILRAKTGDPDAIKALAGEDPRLKRALAANAPGAKEAREKAKRERDSAIGKTAGSLQDTVGRELLANPDMGVPELWGKIKEAMEKAGYSTKEIVDTLPGISTKIREDMEAKVRERADREGISADAARKGMLADAAERDKRKAENTPEYREAQRLAGAMDGKALLQNGGISDADLEKGVRKNLKSAGLDDSKINESAAQVAKILREKVEAQVQERALGQGISEGEARAQMLKERMDQENRDAPKAEVLSTESYLNKLLVAGAGGKDDIPRDQLNEQRNTNKKLDSVIKELGKAKTNQGAATFARGRA